MKVNTSAWQSRNLWINGSGDLVVRPACRKLYAPSGRDLVGGASVSNPRTNENWHYTVDVVTGATNPNLVILDEDFNVIQTITLATSTVPRAVTVAVIEDQVMVSSPDFPTYWGLVGTGLVRATKGSSLISGRVTLDIPRGLCVGWAGRAVIAGTDALYISDPLQPLVFDTVNILNPPGGAIYGLHVTMGGTLQVCTTDGVYQLSVDAAAGGQLVLGVWQKVTDFRTIAFNTTAASRGTLFGLTERGYRRLTEEQSTEVFLNDKTTGYTEPATGFRPAIFVDYREGRMFGSQSGPMVCMEQMVNRTHLQAQMHSWWESSTSSFPLEVFGLLQESDGQELLITRNGVLRPYGTLEGTATDDLVEGALFDRLVLSPDKSYVTRTVDFATDSTDVRVAVNSTMKTTTVPQAAPVIGTDSWDAASLLYAEASFRSRRFNFAIRGDNIVLQTRVKGSYFRLDRQLDIQFAGPGKRRRT